MRIASDNWQVRAHGKAAGKARASKIGKPLIELSEISRISILAQALTRQ
jgi:hypothetical protein